MKTRKWSFLLEDYARLSEKLHFPCGVCSLGTVTHSGPRCTRCCTKAYEDVISAGSRISIVFISYIFSVCDDNYESELIMAGGGSTVTSQF